MIQFMTLIMENAIKMEGMPDHFFVKLFSIMYIGMAPITAVAAIISEEKEKNTLRVLMMANVKPWQYLIGVGFYVWVICMLGASVMSTAFSGQYIVTYLCFMGIGFMVSIVVGAWIGFFVSFLFCSFVGITVSRWKEKVENIKMEKALSKFQKD